MLQRENGDQPQYELVDDRPTKPPRHFASSSLSSSSSSSIQTPATASTTTTTTTTTVTITTVELSSERRSHKGFERDVINQDQILEVCEMENNEDEDNCYDYDRRADDTINKASDISRGENGEYCDAQQVDNGLEGCSSWIETRLCEGSTLEEIITSGSASLQSSVFRRPSESSAERNGDSEDFDKSTYILPCRGGLFIND